MSAACDAAAATAGISALVQVAEAFRDVILSVKHARIRQQRLRCENLFDAMLALPAEKPLVAAVVEKNPEDVSSQQVALAHEVHVSALSSDQCPVDLIPHRSRTLTKLFVFTVRGVPNEVWIPKTPAVTHLIRIVCPSISESAVPTLSKNISTKVSRRIKRNLLHHTQMKVIILPDSVFHIPGSKSSLHTLCPLDSMLEIVRTHVSGAYPYLQTNATASLNHALQKLGFDSGVIHQKWIGPQDCAADKCDDSRSVSGSAPSVQVLHSHDQELSPSLEHPVVITDSYHSPS